MQERAAGRPMAGGRLGPPATKSAGRAALEGRSAREPRRSRPDRRTRAEHRGRAKPQRPTAARHDPRMRRASATCLGDRTGTRDRRPPRAPPEERRTPSGRPGWRRGRRALQAPSLPLHAQRDAPTSVAPRPAPAPPPVATLGNGASRREPLGLAARLTPPRSGDQAEWRRRPAAAISLWRPEPAPGRTPDPDREQAPPRGARTAQGSHCRERSGGRPRNPIDPDRGVREADDRRKAVRAGHGRHTSGHAG